VAIIRSSLAGNSNPFDLGADTFFTPGAGIFTPQSFFGAAPFDAPPFARNSRGVSVSPAALVLRPADSAAVPAFPDWPVCGPGSRTVHGQHESELRAQAFRLLRPRPVEGEPDLTLTMGLRYDVDFFPSATDIRFERQDAPTNYGNVQPRVGLAYAFRQGKGVVRRSGLFTGPFDYSDIMVSWQGASAFTDMNQPILPEFANPANDLVGLGPSGIVGVSGPFLPVRHSPTSPATAHTLIQPHCVSFRWICEAQVSQPLC